MPISDAGGQRTALTGKHKHELVDEILELRRQLFDLQQPANNAFSAGGSQMPADAEDGPGDLGHQSQSFLQLVIDSLPVLIFYADRDERYRIVNRAFEEWYGLSAKDVIGQTIKETLNPVYGEIEPYINAVLAGETVRYERVFAFGAAKGRNVDVQCLPHMDKNGNILGFFTLARDITEHKLAEQALRESEQRFRDFAEATSDWFWEMDTDDRYVLVTNAIDGGVGMAAEWFIGKTTNEIVERFYERADWQPYFEAVEARRPYRDMLLRRTGEDGKRQWINSSGRPFFDAEGNFKGFRGTASDVTEQKEAEQALAANEERFRSVIDHAPLAISLKDLDGRIELINETYETFFKVSAAEVLGKTSTDLYAPDAAARQGENDRNVIENKIALVEDTEVLQRDLPVKFLRITKFPVFDQFGQVRNIGTFAVDISGEKAAEERLRQAQKMEAVGQLTGGIAHEFNNLLQVIVLNLDVMATDLPADHEIAESLQVINRNVTRGADLTDRLLSFSRRQRLAPATLMIEKLLTDMQDMLQRTLGETIDVKIEPAGFLWTAEADLGQLENALLNLALNARDAMPEGGVITLSATNIVLGGQVEAGYEDVAPGDYVMLSVTDNGSGMSEEDRGQAFEPFFTTKDVGEGTGLGLSMVYGFAQQSRGFAEIESELGYGTTVHIYLPRSVRSGGSAAAAIESPPETTTRSSGTILLVEDDKEVRQAMASQLIKLGYQVTEAENGVEALAVMADGLRFDLLFTDVVMPGGLNGLDLARQLQVLDPTLKALYSSGYSEDVVAKAGHLEEDAIVLHKPYNSDLLAATISRILD